MIGQGVRQFLDLGSGLPSMANTHEVAQRVAPEARVVYVDIDRMGSFHASARMAGSNVVTLRADLREPEMCSTTRGYVTPLYFGQPVGNHVHLVLHCLWDKEDPWAVVRQFLDAVTVGQPPGPEPHDQRSPPGRGPSALPDDPGPALEHPAHIPQPRRHHAALRRVHAG